MKKTTIHSSHWRTNAIWFSCLFLMTGSLILVAIRENDGTIRVQGNVEMFPGFTADELDPPKQGLVVTSLRTDSEAKRDGVRVGDEIIAIGHHPVKSLTDAAHFISQDANDKIFLRVLHNNTPRDVVLLRNEETRDGA